MDPDHRIRLLEEASLHPPLRIAGHELRPFALASFVVLRHMKNRLVVGGMATIPTDKGEVIDFNDPDNIEAVLQFIYVHSAPIREVMRVSRLDAAAISTEVLVHTADIGINELAAAAEEITATIRTAAQAVTETPKETDESEDPDPNAPGPRG